MSRGHVVISGASSGIGEACAHHLAELGFHVFAGFRSQEDGDRLGGRRGIDPLEVDVSDGASVATAADHVRAAIGDAGLAGLVNNAGIAVAGPVEFLDVDEFRRQLDVNVTGVLRMTQSFLEPIRTARGRIVNMSSIGGRVALPVVAPYAASKFALEGLSDALRRELRPWGIRVALIEPGAVATPIWEKGLDQADAMLDGAPPELEERYGEVVAAVRKESEKNRTKGVPPLEVAEAVADALTASRPKTRYLVGRDAKLRAPLAKLLPARAMDALIGRALGQRDRT